MASRSGIPAGLTAKHWEVIRHIREEFGRTGVCPVVYSTCRSANLRLRDLKALFPTGYMRGACRLAGITYRDRFVDYFGESGPESAHAAAELGASRATRSAVYRVDVLGFLHDPADWDEEWAVQKAGELRVPGGLTDGHWRVLRSLRRHFAETGVVPTVIECCEANGLELEEMEALFPGGYHREAVKIAGLCVRPGVVPG
jgi:tRNA 2-thiouridine synthesizing protein E